jgi:hypothetical protein
MAKPLPSFLRVGAGFWRRVADTPDSVRDLTGGAPAAAHQGPHAPTLFLQAALDPDVSCDGFVSCHARYTRGASPFFPTISCRIE